MLKESEKLAEKLRTEGKEVVPYLVGRKALGFYKFRRREYAHQWSGFSDSPTFEVAREVGDRITADFAADFEHDGVDEVHVVFTRFVSMVTQDPEVIRLLPLEVVEGTELPAPDEVLPLYTFEPSPERVLDALLQSAASELAARQRAMKSATDNAEALIRKYTQQANQARQAEITQEISEIVGGADALASAK